MTPTLTITRLAAVSTFLIPSLASLTVTHPKPPIHPHPQPPPPKLTNPPIQPRQDTTNQQQALLCANWLISTTSPSASICCPGVLQTRNSDTFGAQWCCVGNNFPNATFCGDHEETYDPSTASCSASFEIGAEGYTSSVLSAGSKYGVTKAVHAQTVTGSGGVSTSCEIVTAGVVESTGSATSLSTGVAKPAITVSAFGVPIMAVGGLLLAL